MKITERFEIKTELRQCPGCGRQFRVGADSPTIFDSRYCRETHKVLDQPPISAGHPQVYRGEVRMEKPRKGGFRQGRHGYFY